MMNEFFVAAVGNVIVVVTVVTHRCIFVVNGNVDAEIDVVLN